MFDFLEKEDEEYKKFNSILFTGKDKIVSIPIKTFLWLPNSSIESPEVYLYFDNAKEYSSVVKVLRHIKTIINLIGTKNYSNNTPQYEIKIKNLRSFSSHGETYTESWFSGYVKFGLVKHITYRYVSATSEKKIFDFYISKSDLLRSSVFLTKNFNGELTIKDKKDMTISSLDHLDVLSVSTDAYIGEHESNILRIDFNNSSNSFLEFVKNKLPIVEYILAITSFAERKRLYWFKSNIIIDKKPYEYYRGDRHYANDSESLPLIDRVDFNDFLTISLTKKLDEIKDVLPFFIAFSNIRQNSIESAITGMIYLLEKYIRHKGDNPDKKMDFIARHRVYVNDLIPIKDLKNVRNCIAHGHDLPFNDLVIALIHIEVLLERVFLMELNWSFSNSNVSLPYLAHYNEYYKIKMFPSIEKINKLCNKRK